MQLLQFCDHVSDETLDFREWIGTIPATIACHNSNTGCELSQGSRMVLLCQLLHQSNYFRVSEIGACLHLRSRSHLKEGVCLVHSSGSTFFQNFFCCRDDFELFSARCNRGFMVRCCGHAISVGCAQFFLCCLLFIHVLRVSCNLILERLLHHLIVVLGI